ncbi:MAG TPA: FAD-dependent oxidoreductase, partial [Gemmatimonadaceae bacterium]
MSQRADVVVCGAGIAGVAAAYHLAARKGVSRVTIVDEREPLTLTSDKGTQGYRNWWPGPDATMLRFISRSIAVMEEMADESRNAFRLGRTGYLFVTGSEAGTDRLRETAHTVSGFGMGPVREHPGQEAYRPARRDGYRDQPVGADLLAGEELRRAFPFLASNAHAALHVRRAGCMNGHAMGAWMLARALGAGATFVRDKVTHVATDGGRMRRVDLASGESIDTDALVIAAGPLLPEAARMLGVELPVFHELHAKLTLRDVFGIVPRTCPFVIWNEPVTVAWDDEQRRELEGNERTRHLVHPLPAGVHLRPVDGPHGDELFLIWTYHTEPCAATWPPAFDPHYAEVVLRGAAQMIPGLQRYIANGAEGVVDGGYYCKTAENRPLIGPLGVEGAFVLGALSGYGLMGAHAGAELVAAHVVGGALPDYARAFLPSRYQDPAYRA